MGAMERRKGARGEVELAGLYRAAGFAARRGQQHRGGPGSPDVIVEDLPGLHIEAKRTERFRLYDALDQARRDAGDGQMPVVHHRRNDCRWVAIVDLDDWFDLIREGSDDDRLRGWRS